MSRKLKMKIEKTYKIKVGSLKILIKLDIPLGKLNQYKRRHKLPINRNKRGKSLLVLRN